MKGNQSFWISVLAVVICGLCIGAFELVRTPYETVEVTDGSFWAKLWSSSPNEIGDTLAGLFGSLAFVAAAIAVVMQSFELRAQRQELKLTRDVMKEQKTSAHEMAVAMAAQTVIFEDQQKEREQSRYQKFFEETLNSIYYECIEIKKLDLGVDFGNTSEEGEYGLIRLFEQKIPKQQEKLLRGLSRRFLTYQIYCMIGRHRYEHVITRSGHEKLLLEVSMLLKTALSIEQKLSDDQQLRLKSYHFPSVIEAIDKIISLELGQDLSEEELDEMSIKMLDGKIELNK